MGSTEGPPEAQDTAVRWLMDLCAHDTTTGHEDRGLPVLLSILEEMGAEVALQAVAVGRSNVVARWGEPRVLYSTHTDTVPPYIAPTLSSGAVRGRGACDAKGQIVAQLAAISELLRLGVRDVAWLGVVGEETDSIGAQAAADALSFEGCQVVIVGEPTEAALATGQRGIAQYRIETRGRSAHSSRPERGRNAILDLIDWLQALRALPPATDQQLGTESWNLAVIAGGLRANIVPDRARAELLARTVPGSSFDADLRRLAPPGATVDLLQETPPARFPAVPGFEHAPMPFGSDAPRLRRLAAGDTVVLAGPGRIDVTHGDDEEITYAELAAGIELNVELARTFLGDTK